MGVFIILLGPVSRVSLGVYPRIYARVYSMVIHSIYPRHQTLYMVKGAKLIKMIKKGYTLEF